MKRESSVVLATPVAWRAAAAIACAAALAACPNPGAVDVPPVAFAGLDQIAAPNTTVTLDGSGSYDPDGAQGAELEHAWLPISVPAGSSAVLSDDRIAMPTVAVDLVGSYIFRLVVTDANGNESLPDVVAVTVNPYLEVVSVVPVDGAIDTPADTRVVAIFSEPVQAATVNALTVLLGDAAGAIDVAITLDEGNTVAVVRPTAALAHGTVYTFELRQEIRTLRGFSLAQPLTSTFTTAPGADATPPRVVSVAPANGVGDVGRSESVTVTFSEPIDPATVTATTFTLYDGTADVESTIAPTAGDLRATLTPSAPLTGGLVYDVTVATGVRDVAGNALAAPFTSTFSTSSAADTSPPAVVAVDPGDGFSHVAIQSPVVVTFSEPVSPSTVTDRSCLLTDPNGATVAGSIAMSVGNTVATLTPAVAMAYETTYTVNVTGGVTDWDGNPITPFSSTFDTVAEASDFDRFGVAAAPTFMTVGGTATLTITSKRVDGATNIVYNNLLPVLLSHNGNSAATTWSGAALTDNGDGTASLAGGSFINGVATVSMTATVPQGPIAVTVLEQDTGLSRTGTTTASGTDMTWQVGSLDHFIVVASPTTLDAGTPVNITVTAADEYDNTILAYSNAEALDLTHTGTAATTSWLGTGITDNGDGTASIASGTFFGGVALARLVNDSAEGPVTISVTDRGGAAGSTADSGTDVTWSSGGLVGFEVTASPTDPTAGEATAVRITAKDSGGNTIATYQNTVPITLAHSGTAAPADTTWAGGGVTDEADGSGSLAAGTFVGGVATVTLANDVAEGPVVITVTENDSGQSRSGNTVASRTSVTWGPAALDHFELAAFPTQPQTSSSTTVSITAKDAYSNTIRTYQNATSLALGQSGGTPGTINWGGAGVTDDGNGMGSLDTSGRFGNGLAAVLVSNTTAEGPVNLTVSDGTVSGDTAASGTSPTWVTGGIFNFDVSAAPTNPTAGSPTILTITAKDSGGNTIAGYQNTVPILLQHSGSAPPASVSWSGAGVTNQGDGTGRLDGASRFVSGVATVIFANSVAEGPVVISIKEQDTGSNRSGNTNITATNVTWSPGVLDHFAVGAFPTAPQTGSSSTVTITAQDVYGNTIAGYQNTLDIDLTQSGGTGATLTWGGAGVTDNGDGTAALAAGQFSGGGASALVSDSTAEGPVELIVTENDAPGVTGSTAASGSSVTWQTGGIFSFEVVAVPTDPAAGNTTTITITAKDSGGNTIAGYQNTLDVVLTHSGSAPAAAVNWGGAGVSNAGDGNGWLDGANRFVSGVATVTLSNNVAEGPVIITVTEQDTGNSRTGNTNLTTTNVSWAPSALDHFAVSAFPTAPQTNSSSTVTITAQDVFDNTIPGYDNTNPLDLTQKGGTAATMTWGGTGVTDLGGGTGELAAGQFGGGTASVLVTNTTAEGPVELIVTETDALGATGSTAASGSNVTWQTGGIFSFEVTAAPATEVAGNAVTVTITAKDTGGNTITGYQNTLDIILQQNGGAPAVAIDWGGAGVTSTGDGTGRLDGANRFLAGVATVTLADNVAEGPVIVTVTEQDTGNNRTGNTVATSTNVTWTPGPVDHFDVMATPTALDTSQASTVTITARDVFDNMIDTYDNTNPITLDQDGSTAGKFWNDNACLGIPSGSNGGGDNTLAGGCWAGGQTSLTLRSSVAEGPVVVTVTENDTPGASGSSPGITWDPGQIDHFYVVSDVTLRTTGEQATITIQARDQFDNVITAYDNIAAITLAQTGATGGKVWDNNLCLGTAPGSDSSGGNTLTGGCWAGGVLSLTLENQVAEANVNVIVTENDSGLNRAGSLQIQASRVTWEPGPLDHFDVRVSSTSDTAGRAVTVTMTAQDQFDNIVTAYDNIAAIALDQSGSVYGKAWDHPTAACLGSPGGSNATGDNTLVAGCWVDGVVTVTLENTVSEGPIAITVTEYDTGSGLTGSSAGVTWTPGGLDHFRLVAAPTGLVAGSASDVAIMAEDLYSNVITTYGNTAPIDLTQNAGTTGITWTGLGDCAANVTDLGGGAATMTDCFLAGVAQVQVANLQAEGPVTAAATENDTALFRSGTTAFTGTNITWTPAAIDHFWVTASPTSLAVNSATSLTIQAEDGTDFPAAGRGNPIPGYATSNPVDVVPSCAPACAGSISYTPAAWDNGDDTATIPAGTAFDGLGQIAMTVSADFDTSGSPTTITVTQQVSLETGDTSPATGSDTDVSWLSVGCPAPTASPAVIGGSPVSSCAIALDGTASTGGGTETISTYAWTFIYVPAGSAVNGADLTPDAADSAPAFTADRPGSYVVELAVTNSCGNDNTKSLLIDYVPGLPAAGDVLITEVITDPRLDWSDSVGGNGVPYDPTPSMTGSPRSSNDQWVELYNATACPIDLSVSAANPDGWTLLVRDTSGTETPQLGSDAACEWFTPGSSLTSLLPGGYMIIGDPARGGGGGGTRMEDELFLELWYGQVGGGVAVDDVELDDPGGQNEEADIHAGDPDGDGAPAGTSTSVNDEAIYRHLAPPYADTDVDVDDWAQTTAGATPGADNEP